MTRWRDLDWEQRIGAVVLFAVVLVWLGFVWVGELVEGESEKTV